MNILIKDKATHFRNDGKVILIDSVFDIIEELQDKCIIENDSFGRITVNKNELEQFYIENKDTKKKILVGFEEYSKISLKTNE